MSRVTGSSQRCSAQSEGVGGGEDGKQGQSVCDLTDAGHDSNRYYHRVSVCLSVVVIVNGFTIYVYLSLSLSIYLSISAVSHYILHADDHSGPRLGCVRHRHHESGQRLSEEVRHTPISLTPFLPSFLSSMISIN